MSKERFIKPPDDQIKNELTELAFQVTQMGGTERPFENVYWNHFEKGLYVDVITGEPLFSSRDKFNSSCGWPSFAKPIMKEAIKYREDTSFMMHRIEVRSQISNSHLGHVFDDGPESTGGMRYCINSAALRFVSFDDLEDEGYSDYIKYV